MKKQSIQAFTLVELSIVLVIVGLIVGGVVGGQSLIHSAKINKVVLDINKMKIAFRAFELQYDALPGDMVDAYDYWGTTCHGAEASCNGNGNNKIEYTGYEDAMAWRHITLADIYPGEYTGVGGGWMGGVNMPEGPFSGTGYAYVTPDYIQHQLIYYAGVNVGGSLADSALSPSDAKRIDKKMDDGEPRAGKIFANGGWDGFTADSDCFTGSGVAARYDVAHTLPSCRLEFIIDGGKY